MKNKALIGTRLGVVAAIMIAVDAHAGDPIGVTNALRALTNRWPESNFSTDVSGLNSDNQAVAGTSLSVEHEATLPGYITYVRVNSHGDLVISQPPQSAPTLQGDDALALRAPLGREEVVALYSSVPLREIASTPGTERALGSDRKAAEGLVAQINQLAASGARIAVRHISFDVAAESGGTEYTTRSIIRRVRGSGSEGAAASTTIPSRIEFEFDSERLTDRGKQDLDVFGQALVSDLSEQTIVLEGHTDSMGTDEYNQSLSERRAKAARSYLVNSFGIPESRITAVGKGKSNPVGSNTTDEERARNRRVDFIFSSHGSANSHK
jgi:outer membrane protein OmpA-like peptidoglycan-associated protein